MIPKTWMGTVYFHRYFKLDILARLGVGYTFVEKWQLLKQCWKEWYFSWNGFKDLFAKGDQFAVTISKFYYRVPEIHKLFFLKCVIVCICVHSDLLSTHAKEKYWQQKWYLYFWNPCDLRNPNLFSKKSIFGTTILNLEYLNINSINKRSFLTVPIWVVGQ